LKVIIFMDELDFVKLGLNRNEAKVYIYLLKNGESLAGGIIKFTALHRNIVYDNLEKLIEKGLVSFVRGGNGKIFRANSFEAIEDMLEKDQKLLGEKKTSARKMKKEIEKLVKGSSEEQDAIVYRGINGIKAIMRDTLKDGKDYVVFGAPKFSNDLMGNTYWLNYNLKREKKKMKIKMIFNEDLREWSKTIRNKLTMIKFLPEKFDSITETIVYGDKIAIMVWTEKPIATLIKDKNLAKAYRKYFEILWKESKR